MQAGDDVPAKDKNPVVRYRLPPPLLPLLLPAKGKARRLQFTAAIGARLLCTPTPIRNAAPFQQVDGERAPSNIDEPRSAPSSLPILSASSFWPLSDWPRREQREASAANFRARTRLQPDIRSSPSNLSLSCIRLTHCFQVGSGLSRPRQRRISHRSADDCASDCVTSRCCTHREHRVLHLQLPKDLASLVCSVKGSTTQCDSGSTSARTACATQGQPRFLVE